MIGRNFTKLVKEKRGRLMTRKDVLEWAREKACDELFQLSANYAMTRPKPGYERKHRELVELLEILDEMIEDV